MTDEYTIRMKKADEINEKISDLALGILIVGSVAYNSNAVTKESDLDIVAVLDFSQADFKELYRRIDQEYESLLAEHAKVGRINNVSIVWNTPKYEVGLHLWDKTAFDRVIGLKGYNFIFRRTNFGRNFKSTADVEILRNLRGEERKVYKEPREVEGGHVLKFYIFFEDEQGFYPGIQVYNLLLDPVILSEKGNIISDGIESFKENLREKLRKICNASSEKDNLHNALHPKLKEKVTPDLRQRLKDFF